jgi:hypothetical protein
VSPERIPDQRMRMQQSHDQRSPVHGRDLPSNAETKRNRPWMNNYEHSQNGNNVSTFGYGNVNALDKSNSASNVDMSSSRRVSNSLSPVNDHSSPVYGSNVDTISTEQHNATGIMSKPSIKRRSANDIAALAF